MLGTNLHQQHQAAFGFSLASDFPFPGVESPGEMAPTRRLRLRLGRLEELEGWRDGRAEAVFGRTLHDGSVAMSVHRHPAHGLRLFGLGCGTYELSSSGDELVCAPPDGVEPWEWQRFLAGHALPLAAVVSGLEVLHASAVAIEGRVVAIVGRSGVGKTTLALHLASRGARFFTDDVLAVGFAGDELRAYPGAGVVNLAETDYDSLARLGGATSGQVIGGKGQDLRVVVPREGRALPLAAVYFVERPAPADAVRFEPSYSAARVLGSSFNLYLRDAGRLRRHFDVCTAVARQAKVVGVRVPADASAAELAAALAGHIASHV